jgi:hypothetical protein
MRIRKTGQCSNGGPFVDTQFCDAIGIFGCHIHTLDFNATIGAHQTRRYA